MARPTRAVFVTLTAGAVLTGLVGGAQAVPGNSAGTSRQGLNSTAAAPLVLAPAKTEGAAPTATGVRAALAPVLRDPALGKHFGAYVYDSSRG